MIDHAGPSMRLPTELSDLTQDVKYVFIKYPLAFQLPSDGVWVHNISIDLNAKFDL